MTTRHNCVGPNVVNGIVQEPCSFGAIISPETALLSTSRRVRRGLALSIYCVACQHKRRLRTLLFLRGPELENGDNDRIYDQQSCFKYRFQATRYSASHILLRQILTPTAFAPFYLDSGRLQAGRNHTHWTARPIIQEVIRRYNCIWVGEMSQNMLVCLDIEFSALSRKVFEVGVCEFDSGTSLVNAGVKHNCSEDELHKPPPLRAVNQYGMLLSLRSQQKIYHKSQPSDILLGIYSLVTKVRDGGNTPDTIILVWETSDRDLELVGDLFYGAGNTDYRNILPPKDHCVFVIPDFRRNMSILSGSGILHLEVIFNLLFGNRALADKTHRALLDALQLRLVKKLLIELCKPPEQ